VDGGTGLDALLELGGEPGKRLVRRGVDGFRDGGGGGAAEEAHVWDAEFWPGLELELAGRRVASEVGW